MDSTGLATAAGRYHVMRGLLLLPAGLVFVAAGLFDMPPIGDEPVSRTAGYFFAAVAIAVVGCIAANRYYARRFGTVDPSTQTKVKISVFSVLTAVGLAIGILVDTQDRLPISVFGAVFAVAWLAYYRVLVGLRPYHWVFLGGCGIVSLIPIWDGVNDKISPAMIAIGLATIGVGVFDHRDLVTSIERLRSAGVTDEIDAPA